MSQSRAESIATTVFIVAVGAFLALILGVGEHSADLPSGIPERNPAPIQRPTVEPIPVDPGPVDPRPFNPDCPDGRCPNRPQPRPRAVYKLTSAAAPASIVNGRALGGEVVTCDYPPAWFLANRESAVDKQGLCVSTALESLGRYLGLEQLDGFQAFCAREPGGADSAKIEDQLRRFCTARGLSVPRYVSYYGPNPIPLLERLDSAGLPFAHSLGHNPRYRSWDNLDGEIAHMVFGVKWSGKYAVDVDNNEIGGVSGRAGRIFEWTTLAEQLRRMPLADGNVWVWAFLTAPPPPHPRTGG